VTRRLPGGSRNVSPTIHNAVSLAVSLTLKSRSKRKSQRDARSLGKDGCDFLNSFGPTSTR
jgi:hypothetical protein